MEALSQEILSRKRNWPAHFLPATCKDLAYPLGAGRRLAIVTSAAEVLKGGIDTNAMSFAAVLTRTEPDKVGDIVEASGCRLDNYQNSAPLCVAHQQNPFFPFPVGKAIGPDGKLHIAVSPEEVVGRFWMAQRGDYAKKAAEVFDLIVEGILNALSIGFESLGRVGKTPFGGDHYREWTLDEVSAVSVGCLGSALVIRDYLSRKQKHLSQHVIKNLEPLAAPLAEWATGWSAPENGTHMTHKTHASHPEVAKALAESSGTAGGYIAPDVSRELPGSMDDHARIKSEIARIAGEHASGDSTHHVFHYHPGERAVLHVAGNDCDQAHMDAILTKLMHVDGLVKIDPQHETGPTGPGWEIAYPPQQSTPPGAPAVTKETEEVVTPALETKEHAPEDRIVKGADYTLTGPSLALKSTLARTVGEGLLTKGLSRLSGLARKDEFLLLDFPSEEKAAEFANELVAGGGQWQKMRPWPTNIDVAKGLESLFQGALPESVYKSIAAQVKELIPRYLGEGYVAPQAAALAYASSKVAKAAPGTEDLPATAGTTPPPAVPPPADGTNVVETADDPAADMDKKPSLPFLQGLCEYIESHINRQEAPEVVEFAHAMLEEARELGNHVHPDEDFGGEPGLKDGAEAPVKKDGEEEEGEDKKEVKPKADKSPEEEERDDKETDDALAQYKSHKARKVKKGHVIVLKGMHPAHRKVCKCVYEHLKELGKMAHGDVWTRTHGTANMTHCKSMGRILKGMDDGGGDGMDDGEDDGGDSMGGGDDGGMMTKALGVDADTLQAAIVEGVRVGSQSVRKAYFETTGKEVA